jgi:glyoxylase-like metal-dependent hydrolase (beta-lactamase superfamily II)
MINRRSVPALHRACLHQQNKPEVKAPDVNLRPSLLKTDMTAGMVVDPGGDVDRILAAIDKTGAVIEKIVLTHGHLDHAGGASALQNELQAKSRSQIPIEGPDRRDEFLLNGIAEQAASFGFEASNVTPAVGWRRARC